MAETVIASCPTCGYPIAAHFEGEAAVCTYCGEKLEAAISQGITIPTPLFIGVLAFLGGMLIGPAIIASTSAGREWLEEQARAAIRK